ncbi:MAG: nickel-responsive transcriptional regulator NikR [Candidatus Omnitrophica bacterium]|nr:nickel-responsive transcriptional regulator NikR [Candidatus Omnitrophota bacterium]MCM8801967.1 nickel-responsive transcriptional regulator NikR [Candidatus Omnitrophota bacterium]
MGKLKRFGVSMEKSLLEKFDNFIKKQKYKNRSEAIRDIIREKFVEQEWEKGKNVTGCIVIVYEHDVREIVDKIIDIQHKFSSHIISSQHIHMNEENCMEIIAVKGEVEKIKELYFSLKSLKGVKYSKITKATTGKKIE